MNPIGDQVFSVPETAKWAFTTRRVVRTDVKGLSTDVSQAVSGDLVLGRIMRIGNHKRIQLAEGRPSTSYVDDLVVLTCGDRYAPDQFEGIAELNPDGADLLAGGGILGQMRQATDQIAKPTLLKPLGLLKDAHGRAINVADYALPPAVAPAAIPVVAVIGASMNSGKTVSAASLIHGLHRAGLRVAGLKATGTGAFGDFNTYLDAGAAVVADFTDVGMASTYRQPLRRIEAGLRTLIAHAGASGAEVAVVEIADGVFQQETAWILRSPVFRSSVSELMFAAPDALCAVAGVRHLREIGFAPFAISGKVSCSPMASDEAECNVRVPVMSRADLCDPVLAIELFGARLGLRQAA